MENVIENNRLIAEFMGWESNRFSNLPEKLHRLSDGEWIGVHQNQLEYNSSWDWLMPVVDKIEMTQWDITKTKHYEQRFKEKGISTLEGYTHVYYDDRPEFLGWFWSVSLGGLPSIHIKDGSERAKTRLEAYYLCVVEFIKWYNSQKPQP